MNDQPAPPAVPLLDVPAGNAPFWDEIRDALERVCQSGRFLHGPDCRALEEEIAATSDTTYAVGCASGSDALLLSLMAGGIQPGDEVIVPSFTFFATASCVWRLGACPVFADIDPETYNLDPASVEAALTPRTRAVIPVHLFGQCADMDAFRSIGDALQLFIVEDAAQAIGARSHGRPAGSMGDLGCFSFYPTKNLGAFGDAGMVTTSNEGLAERVRLVAAHGMQPRYYHRLVGINSRLDSLQAAVLRIKLKALAETQAARRERAHRYDELLRDAGLDDYLGLPFEQSGHHHVWNQYTIRVPGKRRDALRQYLADAKIGTEIYYPVPLHAQECFRELGYMPGSLPHSERAADEVFSLPVYPEMTDQQQDRVVEVLGRFCQGRRANAA